MSVLDDLVAALEADPAGAERLHALLADAVDPDRRFTAGQMAERWGANPRTVERWCRDGRIPAAVKVGHRWLMPADAVVEPKRKKDLGPARANARHKLTATDAAGVAAREAMRPKRTRRSA